MNVPPLAVVPALPFLAVPLTWGFCRFLPSRGGEVVAGTTGLALVALVLLRDSRGTLQATWFASGGFEFTIGLTLDGLTWFAAMVVAMISLLVALYAIGYMANEEDRSRFFAELGLFIGAMLTLVLASSLMLLFAAWEMVGFASYLLIGFRARDPAARRASEQAFLMTRIGDFGFLLAWLLVLVTLKTTDIAPLLAAVSHGVLAPGTLSLIALLLFLAPAGKSAQLPFTAWLPNAMVAPTPVSALLHSATMVAAGIYLLLRLYPLFAAAPGALTVVFAVGALSAVFSALMAAGEMDLKRILAWSTSSQLGEMVLTIGLGGPFAAALHFAMHASFKSTLFLSAGAVEKRTGSRDLHRLHGLRHVLPGAAFAFLVGALLLAGVQPFQRGSSDEAMLATALAASVPAAALVLALVFLGGVYIGRAGSIVFLGPSPSIRPGTVRPMMRVAMPALAVITAFSGLALSFLPRILSSPGFELIWPWRSGVLLAGALGLCTGAGGLTRGRAAAAAQRLSGALGGTLVLATEVPVRLIVSTAHRAAWIERALDRAVRGLAIAAWTAAVTSDEIERRGLDGSGQHLAGLLRRGGKWLRRAESGHIYLYTLGLFLWSLVILVAGGVLLCC